MSSALVRGSGMTEPHASKNENKTLMCYDDFTHLLLLGIVDVI